MRRLERSGRRTTLLVTTDHGRAADFAGHGGYAPESAQVWLVAAGWGIERRGLVSAGGKRHLADVTATLRALGGVGAPERSSDALAELLEPADVRLSRNP